MVIKALKEISEEVIAEIRAVEKKCKEYDQLNGDLFLDTSLNFYPEMKSLFLCYDNNALVSVLFIFMPTKDEVEISAYTLPEYRRRGYFKELLHDAIEELRSYAPLDLLYVCESQSKVGKKVLKKLAVQKDCTEYTLTYKGSMLPMTPQIKLELASMSDVDTVAHLSEQIFHDNYHNAKSIVFKTMEAANRTQYIVKLEELAIGMCAVSFEEEEATIFGLGILPTYQGKGFGKQLVYLIVSELQRMDLKKISLEVDSDNQVAFQLYKQCGFEMEMAFDYYRKRLMN